MRRRREDVVGDALRIVAGVEDDGAPWRIEPDPLHVGAVQDLKTFDAGCRKEGEEIDVLVAEHPSGARLEIVRAQRRIVVEALPEVRPAEPAVVEMRIAAEIAQEALHYRQDELFMRLHELAEERLGIGGARVVRSDALAFLRGAAGRAERWDLVLCDPPYRLAPRLSEPLGSLLVRVLATGAGVPAGSRLISGSGSSAWPVPVPTLRGSH